MIRFWNDADIVDDAAVLGGKGAGLVRLVRAGVRVPAFAVVDADSVASLTSVDDEVLQASLVMVLARLPGPLAVRSSAIDEDGGDVSFAGQHDSVIGVEGVDDVAAAIFRCVASMRSPGALAYRAAHGLGDGVRSAVVIQQLVLPRAAGVAFSKNPTSGADEVVVSSCLGLGEGVVADLVPSDLHRVVNSEIVEATLAKKTHAIRPNVGAQAVDEPAASNAALDDAAVLELAHTVKQLEARFGCPLDVEWTHDAQGFAFVQARPLTALPTPLTTTKKEAAPRFLFDNSNIAESYPGVTAPLTFSYIQKAYAVAYEESARLCGVDEREIRDERRAFATLLARIDGRVYYHLPSWLRVLALYPGYEKNRAHMEQMMGAQASSLVPAPHRRSALAQVKMGLRLIRTFARRHRLIADFVRTFEETMKPLEHRDWSNTEAADVVDEFHAVVDKLLYGWQAPLLADFMAMTTNGRLRDFCEKKGVATTTIADLFAGADIPSVAPARALQRIAVAVQQSPALTKKLLALSADDALDVLRADVDAVEFVAAVDEFVAEFGARAMHELKLEQRTWREEPSFLVRQIQDLVRAGVVASVDDADARRGAAEALVQARCSVVERVVFARLVDAARTWTAHREALRYARARAFAVLRQMALRLGRSLVEVKKLDSERDVFFLTVDELIGSFEGTATSAYLRGLVSLRRREDAASQARRAPADRLAYDTAPVLGAPRPTTTTTTTDGLRGMPVVRGRVQGKVKIVVDAGDAVDVPGCVLVCPRTDPGFVALFAGAKALVVERGSPLSHCAIVARELGLPTIVNVKGVVDAVDNGDVVDVDADNGVVVVVERVRRGSEGDAEALRRGTFGVSPGGSSTQEAA